MTKTLTAAAAPTVIDPAPQDPMLDRAEFFAHLELLELTMVIPQAAAPAEPVYKY